jgi:sugar (pentulose or hexulose) kinase
MLPPIYGKGTALGTVLPDKAEELGLCADTEVILGSFDHPSGALGAGVLDEGQLLLSCGTSWVELFPVADRRFALSTGGLVDRFTLHHAPWCVMKSLESVTVKIDRLREHFFGVVPHKVFDGCAGEAPYGCNGLRFDFTEADFKRAAGHGKSDIARAIIESAALMLKKNLQNLEKCGLRADSITAIGGITNSPICTRIISETLGKDIKVVNGQSAGAVGSCLLGAIGTGVYKDEKEAFAAMKERL